MAAHLQVLWQEGVARVLLHALLEGDARLSPLHRVCPVHNHILPFCDLHCARGVRGDIDLDDTVPIVQNVEVDVREEVVLELVLLPGLGGLRHDLLHLADEAPDGQVIIEHLQMQKTLF